MIENRMSLGLETRSGSAAPFCPRCDSHLSETICIGSEYERWTQSRSNGGIKTDEIFAKTLLNLWENNQRFLTLTRNDSGTEKVSSATNGVFETSVIVKENIEDRGGRKPENGDDESGRSKRIIGPPRRFVDFSLRKDSPPPKRLFPRHWGDGNPFKGRRESADVKGHDPPPVPHLDIKGGSYSAARMALASVNDRTNEKMGELSNQAEDNLLIQRCLRQEGVWIRAKDKIRLLKRLKENLTQDRESLIREFITSHRTTADGRARPLKSEAEDHECEGSLALGTDHDKELIVNVVRSMGLKSRQLNYKKKAQLLALLSKVSREDSDKNILESRRRIAETFLFDIFAKSQRLNGIVDGVGEAENLDKIARKKLKEKLKRMMAVDDDETLKAVADDFVAKLKREKQDDANEGSPSKHRRCDSIQWSRSLTDDQVIDKIDPSSTNSSSPCASLRARLTCAECKKTCRDGKDLQWHRRSIHCEIDAQVCVDCFIVFHSIARLKDHSCDAKPKATHPAEESNDEESASSSESIESDRVPSEDKIKAEPLPVKHPPLKIAPIKRKIGRPTKQGPIQLHCPYPNCNSILSSKPSLWHHKRRHRIHCSSTPFRCNFCGTRFAARNLLVSHFRRTHANGSSGLDRGKGLATSTATNKSNFGEADDEFFDHDERESPDEDPRDRKNSRSKVSNKASRRKIPSGQALACDQVMRPVVLQNQVEGDSEFVGKTDTESAGQVAVYVSSGGWQCGLSSQVFDDDGREQQQQVDDEEPAEDISDQSTEFFREDVHEYDETEELEESNATSHLSETPPMEREEGRFETVRVNRTSSEIDSFPSNNAMSENVSSKNSCEKTFNIFQELSKPNFVETAKARSVSSQSSVSEDTEPDPKVEMPNLEKYFTSDMVIHDEVFERSDVADVSIHSKRLPNLCAAEAYSNREVYSKLGISKRESSGKTFQPDGADKTKTADSRKDVLANSSSRDDSPPVSPADFTANSQAIMSSDISLKLSLPTNPKSAVSEPLLPSDSFHVAREEFVGEETSSTEDVPLILDSVSCEAIEENDDGDDEAPTALDGDSNVFAVQCDDELLRRIVATNCDHDYSAGDYEIFVSVLTTDNKIMKFVIE